MSFIYIEVNCPLVGVSFIGASTVIIFMCSVVYTYIQDLSINPHTAFTMDIVDDKKVRLHLNKTLIKQVLKANNISIDKIGRKGRPRGRIRGDGTVSCFIFTMECEKVSI